MTRYFLPFRAPASSFFSDSLHFFSSPLWLFPPLLFQLSILWEVSLLNFLRSFIYYYHFIMSGWYTPLDPINDGQILNQQRRSYHQVSISCFSRWGAPRANNKAKSRPQWQSFSISKVWASPWLRPKHGNTFWWTNIAMESDKQLIYKRVIFDGYVI